MECAWNLYEGRWCARWCWRSRTRPELTDSLGPNPRSLRSGDLHTASIRRTSRLAKGAPRASWHWQARVSYGEARAGDAESAVATLRSAFCDLLRISVSQHADEAWDNVR